MTLFLHANSDWHLYLCCHSTLCNISKKVEKVFNNTLFKALQLSSTYLPMVSLDTYWLSYANSYLAIYMVWQKKMSTPLLRDWIGMMVKSLYIIRWHVNVEQGWEKNSLQAQYFIKKVILSWCLFKNVARRRAQNILNGPLLIQRDKTNWNIMWRHLRAFFHTWLMFLNKK